MVGKNENVAASPSAPQGSSPSRAPIAWAASSSRAIPCFWQIARSAGASNGWPKMSTASTARVRGVIAASTACGSRQKLSRSMSAKTGVAPTPATASAVA